MLIVAPTFENLLEISQTSSATKNEISSNAYNNLHKWCLFNQVAFVFDTTKSNSGYLNGVCVLLEPKMYSKVL